MPETLRKLPKLAELSKLQALLLLGGAFVFVALASLAVDRRFFMDRTPAVPEGAVFAATVDRTIPYWDDFEKTLPEQARRALENGGDLKNPTLFAVPGTDGTLEWGLIEALSAVTERTGRKKLRFLPKEVAAVGFVKLGGHETPFIAEISRGLVRATVGKTYRGPVFEANPFADVRRMNVPMFQQSVFLEKPAGVSWAGPAALLGTDLQRFGSLSSIWSLPGRVEMAVSASETGSTYPFIAYYRPAPGGNLAGPLLEAQSKAFLAELEPTGLDITLPDGTTMEELRREPDAVQITRKDVRQFGERAQLRTPGSARQMEIFYADSGEAWISDDLNRIQAAIMASVDGSVPTDSCEVGGAGGFAAYSGKKDDISPYFSGFERLTVSLHSLETGLFTMCGYFTP